MNQKNNLINKRRRVLILSNEEKSEDCLNRLTCLAKGWHYTNHDEFDDHQIREFTRGQAVFTKDGWINVIDDNYGGITGNTTTLEGIERIFENLLAKKDYFDVVIIDYYQNIKRSEKYPHMNEWEVQAALANMLDKYKNIYPAPIVVMVQVTPPDKDKTPVEYRIKGRKVITDPATLILEMVADRENLRTEWFVHKSRFTKSVGSSFFTYYDDGKFVFYKGNKAVAEKINKIKEDRMRKSVNVYTPLEKKEENGKS